MISREPDPPQLCFVLDIDGTLATKYNSKEELASHLKACNTHYAHYLINNYPIRILDILVKNKIYPHVLHHAVIEFIKYLLASNHQLAFFSSGIEERNDAFVYALLQQALPKEMFDKVIKNIPIFSREKHIINTEQLPDSERKLQQNEGQYFGCNKKDLNTVMTYFKERGKTFSLDQIFLVDDDPSYTIPGQEKNLLRTFGCFEYGMKGDAQKFQYRLNHLFYVTGLLACISKDAKPIEALHSLQFAEGKSHDISLLIKLRFYNEGLRVLQQINPSLTFVTFTMCQSAKEATLSSEPSDEQKWFKPKKRKQPSDEKKHTPHTPAIG